MAGRFSVGAFTSRNLEELRRTVQQKLREFADIFNLHVADESIHTPASELVKWEGDYFPGLCVPKNTMVLDGQWTMISNKDTCEPAAPQPVGVPTYTLDENDPGWGAQTPAATFLASGNLYTISVDGYLNKIRFYVGVQDPDVSYYVYLRVTDALGNSSSWNSDSYQPPVGWFEFGDIPVLFLAGSTVDLILITENVGTTITQQATWDYTSDNNDVVPGAGEAHRRNNRTWVRFNKDSQAGTEAWLSTVVPGTSINTPDSQWLVGTVTDGGTYYEFEITGPGNPTDGLTEFTFIIPQDIPVQFYYENPGYWTANTFPNATVQGYLNIDGVETLDDTAYGIDGEFQYAFISEDWDLVSAPGEGSGTTPSPGTDLPIGLIALWSGTPTGSTTPPAGWALCDGGTYGPNSVTVPDLRNRFIVGGGGTYAIDQADARAWPGNNATFYTTATNGHAITVAQMPSHKHEIPNSVYRFAQTGNQGGGTNDTFATGLTLDTTNVGSNQAHSHGFFYEPFYYALGYICYVGPSSTGASSQGIQWVNEVFESFTIHLASTTDNMWTTVHTVTLAPGERFHGRFVGRAQRTGGLANGDPVYKSEHSFVVFNDGGGAECADTMIYEDGNSFLGIRLNASGNDIDFEVRGASMQDWDWRCVVFNKDY